MARPSIKTPEICDEIIERIAGGESVVRILKSDEKFPGYSTFNNWLREDKALLAKYAQAKEDQADYMAEEILDISDEGSNDWMENNDPDNPGYKFNGESFQRSRLRVDTRKWIASKFKPKKYGDRIATELSGPEGGPVVLIDAGQNPYSEGAKKYLPDET